jgi:hypothetical protein
VLDVAASRSRHPDEDGRKLLVHVATGCLDLRQCNYAMFIFDKPGSK